MSMETWTPDRVEKLRCLIGTGLSATQMAAEIGVGITRNMVIGKAGRMGWKLESQVGSKPAPAVVKPRLSQAKRHAFFDVRPAPSEVSPIFATASSLVCDEPAPAGGIDHDGLNPHHCRWPSGDPRSSDFRYCGVPRVEGKPYCSDHDRKSIDPNRRV